MARKEKKFVKETKSGKKIYFGQAGASIKPGTKKGDAYCARSAGIKSKGNNSPNNLSRRIWGCKGKKSQKVNINSILKKIGARRI